MIYWKCVNAECEEFGNEILEPKPMFKYSPLGTVPTNIPYCKKCGRQMDYREELPTQEGPISVNFASFNSKSNEDKAHILKKRYKDGVKKENVIQDVIKEKREQVTKQFFGQ